MTCNERLTFGPTAGWTNGLVGGAGKDIIMTPWINTRDILNARVAIKFTEPSGTFQIRWLVQRSDDMVNVTAAVWPDSPGNSFTSAEDTWQVTDWRTFGAQSDMWCRFAIRCGNVTGTEKEKARLHMIVDFNRSV